jgi:hypothetical protein
MPYLIEILSVEESPYLNKIKSMQLVIPNHGGTTVDACKSLYDKPELKFLTAEQYYKNIADEKAFAVLSDKLKDFLSQTDRAIHEIGTHTKSKNTKG